MALRNRIFDLELGAAIYASMTDQSIWLDHAAHMLDGVVDLSVPLRVLDIGCGPGTSTRALARRLGKGSHLCGMDISPAMLKQAMNRRLRETGKPTTYLLGDGLKLPFAERSFDLVTGHSFLYLVPDRSKVLAEIFRVLSPGGALVLLEPHEHGNLVSSAFRGLKKWSPSEASALVTLRFSLSMVGWRLASRVAGRLNEEDVHSLFSGAGFLDIKSSLAFCGLGLLAAGKVPG